MYVSRFSCSLGLLLVMTATSSYADMKLSIKGLKGELAENVEARTSLITPDKVSDNPNFKRYFESEAKKALRALGYYSPTFEYNAQDPKVLVVRISPGKPVLVEQLNVNIIDDGQQDPDFEYLLNHELPNIGDVLNHGIYESFKKSLQNLSLKKGYFDANMPKHQLAILMSEHQAFWNIDYTTGQRYRFGKVTFHNAKIRDDYLANIVPFKVGEEYTAEQLSLLNRRLTSTNWFNSVVVVPDFPHVTEDKVLPIDVETSPRKKNNMDLGLGFSTDNGVHGKIGWNKPWINSRGQSFQSNLSLSSPEQLVTMSYKIPLKKSPLEQYYTIQGGYKKINNNDTYSRSYTFGALRNWDNFYGWQTSLGFNVLSDDFTQGDASFKTFLYYPSLSLSRIRSDGDLLAMWGDSQRYSVEAAGESLGSDINLVRFQAQQTWIRSLLKSHRFIARGNFGIIQASNFDRVPPSFRFFAGGERSIRGYSYQSISPKDKKGKLKGASKLITGSFEYQYNLAGSWWGATFVDTGEAIDKVDKTKFYTGAGFGIRWASPIGPIKIDLATPLSKNSGSVHLYIGLGSEL
ncbi:autotransporter assembly complex protein TamA [Gilliamella sp. App2-1]|uniref:autotransporter assembly complex protein TamA n=2 Tax=unclassified Gilliamella TaxID=2685620 RepID=UPI003FA604D0